jgi:sporulation protein YlmC with PRC-barrel domain
MLDTSDEIVGLDIYDPRGTYVGKVDEIVFDTDARMVCGIIVNDVNPALSEPGISISIPYDWVSAVGDVVILNRFPTRILRNGTPEGL